MEHSVDDLIAAAHPESHLMPGANGIIDQKARLGTVQSSIQAENVRELNSKMENLQVQTPMGRFSRGKSTVRGQRRTNRKFQPSSKKWSPDLIKWKRKKPK